MIVVVLRHGEAGASEQGDRYRALTARGKVDICHVINSRLDELSSIKEVWVSPYVRAQETADIVTSLLPDRKRVVYEELTPDGSPDALISALENCDDDSAVLLVSHQPLVGRFADLICGTPRGYHAFDTASLVAFDLPVSVAGAGTCLWATHP